MRALTVLLLLALYSGAANAVPLVILAIGALSAYGWVAVVLSVVYNVYSAQSARRAAKRAADTARDAYNRSLQDRTVTALSAEPAERYFYGAGIIGGDVVGIFTSDKPKDGTVKKDGYKHIVIVITSHRVKSIKDILIDGVHLGITGSSGWATAEEFAKSAEYDLTETAALSATSLTLSQPVFSVLGVTATYARGQSEAVPYTLVGNVINFPAGSGYPGAFGWNVTYTVADTHNSTVYAEKFLGAADQTANAYLMSKVPGQWTSTDRLQGRSGVVITLDLEEPRFQGGIPRLSFDIEGRDEVFDPRDSTYKYTTNNALCIDDWLRSERWGFGVIPDVDSTIEAANACDVSTTFETLAYAADGTGSTTSSGFTGPRYTLNGGWTSDDDKEVVLGQMAASMGGRVIDGASWLIQAGVWTAPVLDLVDGDEAGPIQVMQTGEAIDDIFNSVRASYLPASQATVADMNPPYQNSTFVTADGRELWEVMTMPFTDQASRVRNLARIAVETARNGLVVQYPAKLKAWEVRPGQRVTVTNAEFAWTAKTFRVTDWQFGLRGAVVLTLIEDAADAWDLADAAIVDPTPNTGLPNPNLVPYLTGLAAASGTAQLLRLDDGTVIPRVRVTWTQSAAPYMDNGRIEIAWRNVIDTDWTLVNAAGADTSAYLLGVLDSSVILVRATAYNSLGVSSAAIYLDHSVVGKTAAPANVAGLSASVVPGALIGTRTPSAEADYDHTIYRYGSTYAGGTTVPGTSDAAGFVWPWPTPGSYTIWAADVDTTGNVGTPVSYGPITVTVAALAPTNVALSIELNVNDFAGTVNYNEAYLHGRDGSGAPVDAPGAILVNGVATAVPNGPLNTNFGPVAGYIMWDSAGSTFSVLGTGTRPYVLARRFQGQWQYDDNNSGSWTNFTPAATHYIIGTLESGGTDAGNPGSAPGLIAASIWAAAVTPNALVAVADAAYAAAAAAQSTADGAATNASAALTRLTAIDSDGILSRGEKPEVIKAWQAISDEKPGIASKASDFSITTLRTAYIAAYDALASYLTALSPAWNDATADTPITPSTDLAAWTAYYDARQALLNETAAEAAKRANWGQIDSRPADNELLNSYVQVGGRNLLTRAAIGGTVTTDYFGGQNAAYLDLGAGGNWRMTPWTSHEVGDYSVSGWIKASVATNVDFDLCDLTPHTIAVTTAWQFFKLEGEFNSSTYLNTTYFGFLDFLSTSACRLTISNLKLETGTKATDWSPAPEDVDTRISAAQSDASTAIIAASDAQATADGKVTTFVQTSPPTAEGVGDLWIDSDDANKLYRWSGSAWVAIRDTGIAAALTDASNAQATADGKIVSFYQTSPPTASAVGDLWIDTDDSNKQYRWSGSAWVSIRDAGIAAAIAAAATAQSTADGKIDSFYQTSAPGAFSDGDIWFDTDDGNKQYVAVSGVWTVAADTRIGAAITAAAGAQATADGKVTTFYASSAPTANAVGDLWANTTSGSTRLSRWSGSAWVVLSVIGTADVDTPQLADSSATDVTITALTAFTFSNIA
ncbi:MAG: hypothetical protein YHS30scaffold667_13 [Phage 65_10]|nr:MAG: hypothetical protein YHS30scaffold667_13 [Phage 65_10]